MSGLNVCQATNTHELIDQPKCRKPTAGKLCVMVRLIGLTQPDF